MCGRFVITSAPEALRRLFGYVEQPNFPPRFNVAPTQPVPVVMLAQDARHFRLMRWGLLPSWVKDPRAFTLLINARAETAAEKPAFRNALRRRRCLIPADGWYEWRSQGAAKQPYFIHRADGAPFGFAGIAETWMGPNGEEVDTVAIMTGSATHAMSDLHHRVPIVISPANFDSWLDCASDDPGGALPLLAAPPDRDFVWHPVSVAVNRAANDGAELIQPVDDGTARPDPVTVSAPKARRAPVRKHVAERREDDPQGSLF